MANVWPVKPANVLLFLPSSSKAACHIYGPLSSDTQNGVYEIEVSQFRYLFSNNECSLVYK